MTWPSSDRLCFYPRDRETTAELMDDLNSDPVLLDRTLRHLVLVNRTLSRMGGLMGRHILQDIKRNGNRAGSNPAKRWTVLDVGAGGCDIPLRLSRSALRRGIKLHVTCLDHDPRVVAMARRTVGNDPAITIQQGSALELTGTYDYIISNHFLHHLTDEEIARFLDVAWEACGRRLLVNDLLRSWVSQIEFRLFASVFFRRSFALADGLTSIRKGFRPDELARFVSGSAWGKNGSDDASDTASDWMVTRRVPGHVVLIASKSPG